MTTPEIKAFLQAALDKTADAPLEGTYGEAFHPRLSADGLRYAMGRLTATVPARVDIANNRVVMLTPELAAAEMAAALAMVGLGTLPLVQPTTPSFTAPPLPTGSHMLNGAGLGSPEYFDTSGLGGVLAVLVGMSQTVMAYTRDEDGSLSPGFRPANTLHSFVPAGGVIAIVSGMAEGLVYEALPFHEGQSGTQITVSGVGPGMPAYAAVEIVGYGLNPRAWATAADTGLEVQLYDLNTGEAMPYPRPGDKGVLVASNTSGMTTDIVLSLIAL